MSRQARQSRPQVICILADNSDSMAGRKAELATNGIRELILRFQTHGPRGPERSYYRLVLITWGIEAELYPGCNMVPARKLDPDQFVVHGDGDASNMGKALELAYGGLAKYLATVIEPHPERSMYPLPVVVIFSDGRDETSDPTAVAKQIRELSVDGASVPLVAVGVSVEDSEPANEELLRSLVCPEYYLSISDSHRLFASFGSDPLATLGTTWDKSVAGGTDGGAKNAPDAIRQVLRRLKELKGE